LFNSSHIFILGLGTAQIRLCPYPNAKVQLIDTGFEVLAAYALTCAELLYQSNKTIIFFSTKKGKRKEKSRRKKICKFKSHVAAAVKVFWKNTT
jgi:hypothetical protein